MQNPFRNLILCAALVGSPLAWADAPDVSECEFPQSPDIADGASISEEQMMEMSSSVRGFVADMQAALECIDGVEAKLGEAITPEQKAALNSLYNNGVDQMQSVAEAYNEQARAFKSR